MEENRLQRPEAFDRKQVPDVGFVQCLGKPSTPLFFLAGPPRLLGGDMLWAGFRIQDSAQPPVDDKVLNYGQKLDEDVRQNSRYRMTLSFWNKGANEKSK